MKFNVDCVRDLLIALESIPYQEEMFLGEIISKLQDKYSYDEICYAILKLDEAGFISAKTKKVDSRTVIISVTDITFDGHQFLADIRSNKLWGMIKEIAIKGGTDSIPSLLQIALKVASKTISEQIL